MSRRRPGIELKSTGDSTPLDPCLPRSEAYFGLDFSNEQSVTVTQPRPPPRAATTAARTEAT